MRNKLPCDRIEMSSSVYTMCKIYCLLYTTHAQATLWCALGCVLRKLNSGLAFKLSSVIIMLGWLAWNVHLHISTYLETMFIESRVNVIHKGRSKKQQRFFWEISPKCGWWVGWLIPKQGPNPSKSLQTTPKIAFFDLSFSQISQKPWGGWVNGFGRDLSNDNCI